MTQASQSELRHNSDRKPRLIILGAGRPYHGVYPSAMLRTSKNRRTLDWILDAFNQVMKTEVYFVGGYRIEDIAETFPDISFSINPNWESHGPLGSLLEAPLASGQTTYVCYSDIVISADIVMSLRSVDSDVVLASDRCWRDRYERRSTEDLTAAEKLRIQAGLVTELSPLLDLSHTDAEFVGLLKLSPKAVDSLIGFRNRRRELVTHGISKLIHEFLSLGLKVAPAEIHGRWAELTAPQDLARFILGTKAETLERLRPLVQHSVIGKQINFTVTEWHENKPLIIDQIHARFGGKNLAVRSSSLAEDTWTKSNAGSFASVLDVPGDDAARLEVAVDQVASSYGDGDGNDQVLVQAMVEQVVRHGVVLTRSLNRRAPYYTLNFDDSTLDGTESVTSGRGKNLRTVIVHRSAQNGPLLCDPKIAPILKAIREIEDNVGHDALDVEFAVTSNDTVHILQVRPLTIQHEWNQVDDALIDQTLQKAIQEFERRQNPGPFILGERTLFGIMPDWNPAEIIGNTPRRLALTLYQYLITDEVWAIQRAEYGYRDVRPHPLMVTFGGHPYIDVRVCFNSFIPASVSNELAERLINYYLSLLTDKPHLHDKIEFDVAFTCLDFNFDKSSRRLLEYGFSETDVASLKNHLAQITRNASDQCQKELVQIKKLGERFHLTMAADLNHLQRALVLIDDCKKYGTLPFAHLARGAFIANSLLQSLEESEVITKFQTESFMKSIHTVSGDFEKDGWLVAEGALTWEEFSKRYAHLRPGTYEITSPTYRENPEKYLQPVVKNRPAGTIDKKPYKVWDQPTKLRIREALDSIGLMLSNDDFEYFLHQAIEGREYSKFVFSRHLSAALDELVKFGESQDLDRDQISHISFDQLIAFHGRLQIDEKRTLLAEQAKEGKKWHDLSSAIDLPPLLLGVDDLLAYERNASQPNFVTNIRVSARSINLADKSAENYDLKGMIVLIPQADPGYDWLFGHGIAGLITMYGGANSHMTIRAAEFDLPAAIGVGQSLYDALATADVIDLDCGAKWVRVLS